MSTPTDTAAQIAELKTQIAELIAQRDALAASVAAFVAAEQADEAAEATALVTAAITAGVLDEEDRAPTLAAYAADKPGTTRLLAKLTARHAESAKPDGHAAALNVATGGTVIDRAALKASIDATPDPIARAALVAKFMA